MPPHVARYAPVLDTFRPCCAPEEARRRCGMLYLRDLAATRLPTASWEAGMVLSAIHSLGLVHAFRSMTPDELATIHGSMFRLMSIATSLEGHGPKESMHGG